MGSQPVVLRRILMGKAKSIRRSVAEGRLRFSTATGEVTKPHSYVNRQRKVLNGCVEFVKGKEQVFNGRVELSAEWLDEAAG